MFNIMLSLEKCKSVLNKGARKYSNEEVEDIRTFLYKIAAIEADYRNNTIKQERNDYERYSLLPCQH